MSTSLLYHAFGIRGYHYMSSRYENGTVIFTTKQPKHSLRCSVCGGRHIIRRGKKVRRLRVVPIGNKPAFVELAVPRVWCLVCGLVRQVKIGFASWRRSYTRGFERYALELSKFATIQDVAQHLAVSWDVIKDIQKRNLRRRFRRPKLNKIKQLAIDEISVGKGHKYLTIVSRMTLFEK